VTCPADPDRLTWPADPTARLSHLDAEPLREVTTWLGRYQGFCDESRERLDELLAALQADGKPGRGKAV